MSDRNNNPHSNVSTEEWMTFRPTNTGSRQQTRAEIFEFAFNKTRQKFMSGKSCFSYVEGMTRKAARKISRRLSKMREVAI